jgi:hypothetical protein
MDRAEAIELLNSLANASCRISDDLIFSIRPDKTEAIKSLLNSSGVAFEDYMGKDDVLLNRTFYESCHIHPYCNFDSFARRFQVVEDSDETIVVLGNPDEEMVIATIQGGTISARSHTSEIKSSAIINFYYLNKIVHEFLPKITDYIDSAHNKYIFLSPECGRLEIEGSDLKTLALKDISADKLFAKITDLCTRPKGYEYILKNRIIRGLVEAKTPELRFSELIINFELFIEATLRDLELFLLSRKHEEIIEQLESEKYQFADKIRSILERISASILSIPITFAVALFALRDIPEKWLINIFLGALALFVVFTCITNSLFFIDLSVVNKEMDARLKNVSMDLPFLKRSLVEIVKPFKRKIRTLKIIIILAIVLFVVLFFFLVYGYTGNTMYPKMIIARHISRLYLP